MSTAERKAALARRAEMRAVGVGYEYMDNDPDAIIEHVGHRLVERLATWLLPVGAK